MSEEHTARLDAVLGGPPPPPPGKVGRGVQAAIVLALVAGIIAAGAAVAGVAFDRQQAPVIERLDQDRAYDEALATRNGCIREITYRYDLYFFLRVDVLLNDGANYSDELLEGLERIGVDPAEFLPPPGDTAGLLAVAAVDRANIHDPATNPDGELCRLRVEGDDEREDEPEPTTTS